MGRLDGKVALVTGAARGQGEAEARMFVAEGAKVVLGDVLDDLGEKVAIDLGDDARYVHLDVTKPDDWKAAVDTAVSAFGKVDVLINNAGILKLGPIETQPLEEYLAVVNVNQVGCFLGIRSAIEPMKAAGGGSIVNISSIDGIGSKNGLVSYTASKFAIRGMTKTAALELGRFGIRVNSIHPGGINTVMGNPTAVPEEFMNTAFESQAIPRIGRPEEIAYMALFLASDESSYCTGGEFVVDGGWTIGDLEPALPGGPVSRTDMGYNTGT
jgi:3alpha(or 20beta)-hydroxysteroid dehydrogenase